MAEAEEWTPVLGLPNLDIRGRIESQYAEIVPRDDARMERLREKHPRLTEFVTKFKGQFGEQICRQRAIRSPRQDRTRSRLRLRNGR